MLTGCTQLVDLSEEESDVLAEYMAESVLKYDKSYKEALVYPDETVTDVADSESSEDTETPLSAETTDSTDAETNTDAIAAGDNTESANSLEEVDSKETDKSKYETSNMNLSEEMGKGKFEISYSNYFLCDSYPNDSKNNYFTIESSKDRQLLVVTFDIKNLSDKAEKLNLIEAGFNYSLVTAAGDTFKPKLTLLVNDIQYINVKIGAEKTEEAVIVFDVTQNVDPSKMKLAISNKQKTAVVKLSK
jgi:hypothetical protein